jgi:hypothetical protein
MPAPEPSDQFLILSYWLATAVKNSGAGKIRSGICRVKKAAFSFPEPVGHLCLVVIQIRFWTPETPLRKMANHLRILGLARGGFYVIKGCAHDGKGIVIGKLLNL